MTRPRPVCPLLAAFTREGADLCLEDRCAWWDPMAFRCAILTAALTLDTIAATQIRILRKRRPNA